MNTMYRCLLTVAALAVSISASAQVQRGFPQDALRGTLDFQEPPWVVLNGKQQVQLSPGARIRGADNMLVMSGSLIGQKKLIVNYTVERHSGLIKDVWLLRKEEAAVKPWPTTPAEAQAWTYDPVASLWTKP
jgi:hypothetical protein